MTSVLPMVAGLIVNTECPGGIRRQALFWGVVFTAVYPAATATAAAVTDLLVRNYFGPFCARSAHVRWPEKHLS